MADVTWDAVVVGAGPSGCAAATALAQHGRSVLLLDRDPEPRFKIGESLLPWNVPIWERLGLTRKLEAAGFQKKYGATFFNEVTGGERLVRFRDAMDPDHPSAYHVKRVEFDGLLAAHAASQGVTVRRGVRVSETLFEAERAAGVEIEGESGAKERISARCVMDATGLAALIASRLKMRRGDPRLRRAAFYAHYDGVYRPEGDRAGDILLPFVNDIWYWVIPFSDGTASVGAVFEPPLVAGRKEPREELLAELLARSPKMTGFLQTARRLTPVAAVSDYSITADRFAGDGWVLVGDAATFLDPVFSTGVFLGMSAGVRAADVVHRSLAGKGRVDGADFRTYERTTRRMVARFRPFVYGYYDPVFTREFCTANPHEEMRKAVTTILAGGVENPSLRVLFWKNFMLMLVGLASAMEKPKAQPAS